ncbi:receptor-like protein Cf-9 [Mangifera indica]|uniref:receptor-like protein Cf-9 n=1 Tax=Mangifera indica TaxID=29780 RepID=UPI001CF9B589|nr:receptor-like protein Cf-9 [Mangifera indica]
MSWKKDKDCCSWDGVTCDSVTGYVIGLDLSCSWLYGNIPSNTSFFLLPQLKKLNLAFNDFKLSKISPDFGRITSLTHLNLSFSNFSGHIPFEISHLSKLVTLDLSSNYFEIDSFSVRIERPVFERLVQNLTMLKDLVLHHVDMSSIVPSSMKNLSSSLTYLSLWYCKLQGNFPVDVFRLPNLQILQLRVNFNLTSHFPKSNWSTPLKSLDVSDMSMSEQLPNSINNLLYLKELFLDNCTLGGSVPTILRNLTQLTSLSLSYNEFNGQIPSFLSNLANLQDLCLSNNNFIGQFPEFFFNLTQLQSLSLSRNQLTGPIPSFLLNLVNLQQLYLRNNSFIGQLPEFFSNLTQFQYLDLSINQLTGPIPSSLFQLVSLKGLDLSSNSLSGIIEFHMFSKLKNLWYLSLSHNNLFVTTTGFNVNSSFLNLNLCIYLLATLVNSQVS